VHFRRWLVLGAGGAGKTTFALELGRILKLPIIHLDRHFWRPGWVEPSDEEWDQQVAELSRDEAWVMDGNYSRTLEPRLARAQAAVLLDPPALRCLWGVIQRGTLRRRWPRPDLAEGCEEQFPSFGFLWYVATYRSRSTPKVLNRIEAEPGVRLYHLRSRAEGSRLLAALRTATVEPN
jgi:adenylate kinase family enzyme